MSSARALSETQVASELAKMQAFIQKEAREKAAEIRVKADEEYELEKAQLVRAELNAVDAAYASKFAKAKLAQQITRSTIKNTTRLKLLAAREEALEAVFAQAKTQLGPLSKDEALLAGLIEEGLYALMEPVVSIRVKSETVALATKAVKTAQKNFEAQAGFAVEVTIDEDFPLDDSVSGGVVIVSGNGKISVDNTLDERLKLLSETALPAIRLELFGPSPSRKYFN